MEIARSRWEPEDDNEFEAASAELKERYATSASSTGVGVDHDVPEGLLHYKWAYVDRHLTRWTRGDLTNIFLSSTRQRSWLIRNSWTRCSPRRRRFSPFFSETKLLEEASRAPRCPRRPPDRIRRGVPGEHGRSGSRFSFGKRLWTAAAAEGVRPDDPRSGRGLHGELQRSAPRAEQGPRSWATD